MLQLLVVKYGITYVESLSDEDTKKMKMRHSDMKYQFGSHDTSRESTVFPRSNFEPFC